MELILKRKTFTDESTIGELSINGTFECYILEDVDRGLDKSQTLVQISSKKVFGKTAIPKGRYEVAITYSNRFQKYLPLLLSVPGFDGIRMHTGNTADDTEGCLITGSTKGNDIVQQSKVAFDKLFSKLKSVEKKEKIFITIQ